MHAHPLMFMFLSLRHASAKQAFFLPGMHCSAREVAISPKKNNNKKNPNLPVMNVPYLVFFFLLNKAFISVRAVAVVVS